MPAQQLPCEIAFKMQFGRYAPDLLPELNYQALKAVQSLRSRTELPQAIE